MSYQHALPVVWAIPSSKQIVIFYASRHKMAEGHIEFTLSLCVRACVCVCVPESCSTHNLVGFKNYMAEMIITTRQCVACKNILLGQRSRSQSALKVFAFQIHVRRITSSYMVGFKNYLAETIITTR